MAIAAVKASKNSTGSTTQATITSLTATAGNALLVGGSAYIGSGAGSAFTVTRTGDTYTTDIEGGTTLGVNRNYDGIASAPNVVAGAADLVLTVTGGQGVSVFVMEFSGLPSSAIKDATSPAVAEGVGTTATTNALTNATADAVYVAEVGSDSTANPATVNDGTGWTDNIGGTTATETNGSNRQVAGMTYQIVSSTASRTADWTVSVSNWGCVIAVYKAASAAAGQPTWKRFGGVRTMGGDARPVPAGRIW